MVEVGQVPGDQVTREVGQVGWTRNMSRVKNTCLAYHDRQVRRRLVQGRLASVDSDVGRQGGARLCLHPPLQVWVLLIAGKYSDT